MSGICMVPHPAELDDVAEVTCVTGGFLSVLTEEVATFDFTAIQRPTREQVIILDEVGFILFSELGAQLLFQVCSALYERVALIITTNLRFGATILEFVGESYRFRERLQRQQTAGGAVERSSPAEPPADLEPA